MKPNALYNLVSAAIRTGDYDKIDLAIGVLASNPDHQVFNRLLDRTFIDVDGNLLVNPAFVTSCAQQQPVDYAFWQIIGLAPEPVRYPLGLSFSDGCKIKLRPYNSRGSLDYKLMRFPSMLYRLKVRVLDAGSTGFEELPETLGWMTALEELTITGGTFRELPASFSNLTSLRRLNLSGNGLEALPADLSRLENLSYLNLSGNKFPEIPDVLGGLPSLEWLDLSNGNFTVVNPVLFNCTKLKNLRLNHNKFPALPAGIHRLSRLSFLDLSFSPALQTIHSDLTHLHELNRLDLSRCRQLKPVPHCRDLDGLENVERFQAKLRKYWRMPAESPNPLAGMRKEFFEKITHYKAERGVPVFGFPEPAPEINKPESPEPVPDTPQQSLIKGLLGGEIDNLRAGLRLLEASADPVLIESCLWAIRLTDAGRLDWGMPWKYDERTEVLYDFLIANASLLSFRPGSWCSSLKIFEYHLRPPVTLPRVTIFPNLETLHINFPPDTIVPGIPAISHVPKVELHHLGHSGVEFINGGWDGCQWLGVREMLFTRGLNIRRAISLRNLRLLYGNTPEVLVEGCGQLKHIDFDCVDGMNAREGVDYTIRDCPNLQVISIRAEQVNSIRISGCPRLNTLHLMIPNLSLATFDIDDGDSLTEVTMDHCGLTGVPDFLSGMKSLRRLGLNDNFLTTLPDFLALPELEALNISGNRFTEFPPVIGRMSGLTELLLGWQTNNSISGNTLKRITGMKPFPKVRRLSVSWSGVVLRKHAWLFRGLEKH